MNEQESLMGNEEIDALDTNMRDLNLKEVYSNVLRQSILYPTDITTKTFSSTDQMRASVDRLSSLGPTKSTWSSRSRSSCRRRKSNSTGRNGKRQLQHSRSETSQSNRSHSRTRIRQASLISSRAHQGNTHAENLLNLLQSRQREKEINKGKLQHFNRKEHARRTSERQHTIHNIKARNSKRLQAEQIPLNFGEIMEIMHKRKLNLTNLDIDNRKALSAKVYQMMRNDPAEVYRILTMPQYSAEKLTSDSVTRNTDWSEEHEKIFSKLNKRSFTVSSLAKSLTFRDMSKQLPKDLHYPDKKWKFDRNSPWVNDLENDVVIGENLQVTTAKTGSVSNINIKTEGDESDISETEELRAELKPVIGDVDKLNKVRLETLKANRTKLQDFHDSFKGFKLISRLEKNPETMSSAISKLASHVIGETKVEMKNIQKARYSYLSTKIAKQRANSTKTKKLYEAAEIKRQELRKRQQQFQTELTKARLLVRKYYPD